MTSPARPENDSGPVTGLISKHQRGPGKVRRKNEAGPRPRDDREVNPGPVQSALQSSGTWDEGQGGHGGA